MYHLKVERNTKEINFGVIKIISAHGDDCHELVKPGAEERKFNLLKPILSQCISLQTENNWSVHSAATSKTLD